MGEEKPLVERFSQEIRRIFLGWNERHTKLESLDHITNKEVAPLNVFGTLVIFRVVREVARGLVVRGEFGWAGDGIAINAANELAEVYHIFGGLRKGNDLGLAR